jgi:HK97 family phage major capsid protein
VWRSARPSPRKLVNGAGTAGPQGILAAAGGTVTGGTGVAGVPTVDNIIDLVYTLDAPYQATASFVMHPTTLSTIAKIKDTTGRSILVPSLATDVPSTMLGYPVFTDPSMPTTGTTKKSIFYGGDLSRYLSVRYAGPLRVDVSYDAKFTSDLVVCKAVQRIDSRIVDAKAGAGVRRRRFVVPRSAVPPSGLFDRSVAHLLRSPGSGPASLLAPVPTAHRSRRGRHGPTTPLPWWGTERVRFP